jgi:hypothetical protein
LISCIVEQAAYYPRGFKGEHKGGAPFDPGNFDVDAFIVSDKLAGQFGSRVRFRSGAEIDGIAGVQSSIDSSLRQSSVFSGLRQDPFTFRIYTQQEIMRLQAKSKSLVTKPTRIWVGLAHCKLVICEKPLFWTGSSRIESGAK